ncbi:MAG: glycoside hydrolase/phage tail family protein [Parvibaculum sp.]|uniref:baseplate multidomain protein megatron n=1 Tax=Parvibaculum sp. TaxID=2024848 RepID=UPI0025FFE7C1|nr:glycoside hydrolase/phage tail family protein [Parvibaculum sp.]MCE9650566.1 glycoside hydrolase/phage tail family protein [Parvibaculum sp.]
MATLVLSTAGSFIGSAMLPAGVSVLGAQLSGAAIGSMIGAGVGAYVDAKLFGPAVASAQGPRLSDLQVLASTEGAAIPRLYGRARLAGQVIWATNFREHSSTTTSGGGKGGGGGGTSVTEYSYTVSFAVALCEGPVTRIGRVWADGKPLALSDVTWRLHRGEESQPADPLIEAVEGTAPAYRGIAYVVFEELNLAPFGNRVPQLSFEVFKTLSGVEQKINAVAIIPGAGEFVYAPSPVRELLTETSSRAANTHTSEGAADWTVALDQLQATCPNVGAASLVVAWFGDDLRCGECTIRPKVEVGHKVTSPSAWRVAGLARADAETVSGIDGRPAYGGTPSDASVVAAIRDLKARGLRATFYPFVMMDIPEGNAEGQPAYPWRGRIAATAEAEMTGAADAQVAAFFGSAAASDFHLSGDTVIYDGPDEWSYRRMILHDAWLCAAAGGVEAFLIGSELCALTRTRSAAGTYPAVAKLKALAADVAAILPGAKISYAADWSEYFGHASGGGDFCFHLDPLWADANIHFIGIDNYAPLTDWRKGTAHLDRAGAASLYDLDYLKSRIAGGEDYDWYYASDADRAAQIRTPISDGAYGKPWVWRAKDIKSWWANAHYNRNGGVESVTPTAWVARGKPIRFTETGCPAIDKGTNQPNVFTDPKSSESAVPHFSSGTRDDFMQRRFIEALMDYWSAPGAHNPVSPVYGGRMLDPADIFFWCWDARPYPAFPDRTDIWSDGAVWRLGHWLNGRLGAAPLSDLVAAAMGDVGFTDFDVSELAGTVEGFVIDRIMSPRDALSTLMLARFFDAAETQGTIRFRHFGGEAAAMLAPGDLAVEDESAAAGYVLTRGQETELPVSAKLTYIDGTLDYRQAAVEARRLSVGSQRVAGASLAMVLQQEDAQNVADVWLQQSWTERESASLKLPPSRLALDLGDVVELTLGERSPRYRLTALTDAGAREAKAVMSEASLYGPLPAPQREHVSAVAPSFGTPLAAFMDLPLLSGTETPGAPRVAVAADPWPGGVAFFKSSGAGFALSSVVTREATLGRTASGLRAGATSRWDWRDTLRVTLASGALASADALSVLGGANVAALETAEGVWEVIQFREAELVAPDTYELRGLLRGQAGTEGAMRVSLAEGARFALLDGAAGELELGESERGLPRIWAYGPSKKPMDDASYARETRTFAGVNLRPLSPVHLRAARGPGGDIALSWIRRTRLDGDGWEGIDVPLAEEVEAYEVDILSGASALRTLAVAATAATYTAAAQTADFGGTTFTTLTVRVSQVSRAFGRGTAREATLHV